ncbi:C39 family peptidase [Streptomyces bauhiniae]|uniref:C39 family peptidase n=1 Tax=Streptomyces bauhiniae TaxID=2340725 RepID=UPI00365C3DDD
MPPPCCTDPSLPSLVHEPVPVVTQYATADLISRIAYEGYEAGNDPRWQTSGAPSQRVYARWCGHICGIACLRMALLHRDGHAPDLFTLLQGARHFGAYVREAGGTEIRGMIYAPFAQYVRATHHLPATVHGTLEVEELVDLLDGGRMVMASVSKEIRRPEREPERRGGHLVLAVGHRHGQILFRNPSGHTPQSRSAALPVERFGVFFGGRGVSLQPSRRARPGPSLPGVSQPVASRPTI